MKLLNSIQLVALVALGPLLIPLLRDSTFYGATALMWVLSITYFAIFIFNIIMVRTAIDD